MRENLSCLSTAQFVEHKPQVPIALVLFFLDVLTQITPHCPMLCCHVHCDGHFTLTHSLTHSLTHTVWTWIVSELCNVGPVPSVCVKGIKSPGQVWFA